MFCLSRTRALNRALFDKVSKEKKPGGKHLVRFCCRAEQRLLILMDPTNYLKKKSSSLYICYGN